MCIHKFLCKFDMTRKFSIASSFIEQIHVIRDQRLIKLYAIFFSNIDQTLIDFAPSYLLRISVVIALFFQIKIHNYTSFVCGENLLKV